jgi:hypothetical protein
MKATIKTVYLALSALTCFALVLTARAVDPAPDGGYPGANTAEGDGALDRLTTGTLNTAIGLAAMQNNTTGSENTAVGEEALFGGTANSHGNGNTAVGVAAMFRNFGGDFNTAIGEFALNRNSTGNYNTANGVSALQRNTTGSNNIGVGAFAGFHLTFGDNNIDIGNRGVANESNTIRIGRKGTQQATFIAGIRGTTTAGMDAVPVVIDSDGQLGTVSSSARFKDEIKPMDKASEAILALKPVTFHYKSDHTGTPQFGLIAEEVAKVDPDLVVRDENGAIYTVRYEAVNAMLLNEFLKEHQTVSDLKDLTAKQQAMMAQQQKQIEALTGALEKVSTRLELNPRLAETVADSR